MLTPLADWAKVPPFFAVPSDEKCSFGELAEWSKAADSKSVVPPGYRRFESYALR